MNLITGANTFPVCLNLISNTCSKGILTRRQFAVVPSPKADDAKMFCRALFLIPAPTMDTKGKQCPYASSAAQSCAASSISKNSCDY